MDKCSSDALRLSVRSSPEEAVTIIRRSYQFPGLVLALQWLYPTSSLPDLEGDSSCWRGFLWSQSGQHALAQARGRSRRRSWESSIGLNFSLDSYGTRSMTQLCCFSSLTAAARMMQLYRLEKTNAAHGNSSQNRLLRHWWKKERATSIM
jgi:hypothetical protein